MTEYLFTSADDAARFVYPRLPRTAAQRLIAERSTWGAEELRRESSTSHPAAAPARTGAAVDNQRLLRTRDAVRLALASADPPFPWPVERSRAAQFDHLVGRELYREMEILTADAASEGVWSFMTLILLPEIGPWRFPGSGESRYIGVPRNVLRRTWWRARILGPELGGETVHSARLGEDELVQIFERPTLAANPWVAKAIVAAVHRHAEDVVVARTAFVRDLTRRLLRLTPVLSLDALSSADLESLLNDLVIHFKRATAPT